MTLHIVPTRMRSRTGSIWIGLILLAPVLALALSKTPDHTIRRVADLDDMIIAPATLIAAVGFYAAWRLTASRALAWVAFSTAVLACEALVVMVVELVHGVWSTGAWALLSHSVVLMVIALSIWRSWRHVFPLDPVSTGFALGCVFGLIRVLTAGLPEPGHDGRIVPAVAVVALQLVVCGLMFSSPGQRYWQDVPLSLGTVLLSSAHLASYLSEGAGAIILTAALLGSALLLCTSLATLRTATVRARAERDALEERLAAAEAGARIERARMHELNSTIAGITSASKLIHNRRITDQRRHLLEDMVQSELGRLERLMSSPGLTVPPPTSSLSATGAVETPGGLSTLGEVNLDCVLTTLSLSQQARGRDVRWSPAGHWALGDVDAVTEILQVLLDNAALHGGGPAEVTITRVGYAIEICVTDSGPGVAPGMRERIFDWGARGPQSRGQGIGLNIARKLAEQQAGYLTLRDTAGRRGATFVLWLPAVEQAADLPVEDHDAARNLT